MNGVIERIRDNKFLFLFIASLIVISDDCYWFSTSGDQTMITIKYTFLAFLPILLFFKGYSLNRTSRNTIFAMVIMTLLSTVVNSSPMGGFLMLSCTILIAALICTNISAGKFATLFSDFMLCMMVFSLFIWVGVISGILSHQISENIGGATILSNSFCVFFSDYSGFVLRNSAIFREPGIFIVLIIISFCLDAFVLKRTLGWAKLMIYLLSIISSLSTAGFIIIVLCYLLYLMSVKVSLRSYIVPIALIGIALYYVAGSEEIMTDVFGKLQRGQDSASVLGRTSSMTIPLYMMLHYPLFGTGTGSFSDIYMQYGQLLYGIRINPQGLATNTFFNSGAIFGLWIFIYIIIGMYRFCNKIFVNRKVLACFLMIIILLTFSNESMVYSPILYVLVFYGMLINKKAKQ